MVADHVSQGLPAILMSTIALIGAVLAAREQALTDYAALALVRTPAAPKADR